MNDTNSNSEILRAENISKCFKTGSQSLEVLKSVNLILHEGEMMALLGASGTGKSTLLYILGTLARADSGRLLYQGSDVSTYNHNGLAKFRNREIGFVYQAHHLLPEFSAIENVMMPGLIRGLSPANARDYAADLLEKVGLSERINHFPNQLSGGEAQRVTVVRALFNKPKVVFADEPTGNLDLKTGGSLMDLFMELNARLNQTFLIATHNIELAARIKMKVQLEYGKVEKI